MFKIKKKEEEKPVVTASDTEVQEEMARVVEEEPQDSIVQETSGDEVGVDVTKAWMDANPGKNDAVAGLLEALRGMLAGETDGLQTGELLDTLWRGLDYERAVEEARIAGEVEGRNATIDELEAEERGSDGVPHPGTGCSPRAVKAQSIFDLAAAAR